LKNIQSSIIQIYLIVILTVSSQINRYLIPRRQFNISFFPLKKIHYYLLNLSSHIFLLCYHLVLHICFICSNFLINTWHLNYSNTLALIQIFRLILFLNHGYIINWFIGILIFLIEFFLFFLIFLIHLYFLFEIQKEKTIDKSQVIANMNEWGY
jgi:hypothetical protein